MDKKLQFIQKVLCLFLCIVIIFSALPITEIVYAKDEVEFYPTSDEAEEDIENMFSTTVKDLDSATKVIQWLARQQTYSITKTVNNKVEKIYVNVPTLPQLVRNTFLKTISDGWDTEMYIPSDKFIGNIGVDEKNQLHTENVMAKFGFNIPVPTYQGEYPKLFMSTSGIIPARWYQKAWRAIKAVFGYSFINAPDAENYKTLYYYNHTYFDADQEKLIKFVQENWRTFEESFIFSDDAENYFGSPEQANAEKVSLQEGKSAEKYIEENKEEYDKLVEKQEKHLWWLENCQNEQRYRETDPEYGEDILEWENWVPEIPEGWTSEPIEIYDALGRSTGKVILKYYDENGEPQPTPPGTIRPQKPNWEKYRDDKFPAEDYPALTPEEEELVAEYIKQLDIYTRWKNFITKMNNGTYGMFEPELAFASWKAWLNNNSLSRAWRVFTGGNGTYYDHNKSKYFYYSQCLLNIEGKEDEQPDTTAEDYCLKSYNGEKFYGDLFNFYIESGAYRISYKSGTKSSTSGTGVYQPRLTPPSQSTPYYSEATDYGEGNSMWDDNGNCTDYASRRFSEIMGNRSNSLCRGNAGLWYTYNDGYKRGQIPQLGAIICYRYGMGGLGHVAIVEKINSDGSITTSESGWAPGGAGYLWKSQTLSPPYYHSRGAGAGFQGFIYNPMGGGSVGLVESPDRKDKLTRQDALKIITTLQNRLGPAYSEVMSNWVTKMQMVNDNKGEDELVSMEIIPDPRIMPYDIDTLKLTSDKQQINISDPRVEIYKAENTLGKFLFKLDFPILSLIINKRNAANFLINTCAGNVTKFSVFLMQLTNLEWFEDHGLSPIDMWNSFSFDIIMIVLALLLVIQIIRYAIKFVQGNAGIVQVIGRFLIFICLMGLVGLFMLNSTQQQTWDVIKKMFSISSGWVEESSWEGSTNVEELLGDKKDNSVSYYIPYFNMWSTYMTGYNIESKSQTIDANNNTPEVQNLKDTNNKILLPTINNQTTKVWAVVLADSFNTYGENYTIVDSTNLITFGKKQIYTNGWHLPMKTS